MKTLDIKLCKNCEFIATSYFSDSECCRKYIKTIDLVHGSTTYLACRSVRSDEEKCGVNGVHFVKDTFVKFIKRKFCD